MIRVPYLTAYVREWILDPLRVTQRVWRCFSFNGYSKNEQTSGKSLRLGFKKYHLFVPRIKEFACSVSRPRQAILSTKLTGLLSLLKPAFLYSTRISLACRMHFNQSSFSNGHGFSTNLIFCSVAVFPYHASSL